MKCKEVIKSRSFAIIVITSFIFFITTNFLSEWRTNIYINNTKEYNKQNYIAIVTNSTLLGRCYVDQPDENYCFEVLKIISSQLNNATFKTSNLKNIWSKTYLYLSSVANKDYPKLHDRIVRIAINEETVKGKLYDFIPSIPKKIKLFQQEIRASYRSMMQLELAENALKKENDDIEDTLQN